ncbi:hypothetical protein [Paractinoplanes rishiriensis]|uniref:Uncharacterized protein n=1 Tax=Paractinoplanes rishiriensis TaxID=1050105 RepID=A0A919K8F6_9ACTN|nr:hypothetical protein [Actinoplanes rishiriensis]GIF01625.1 hypothetical protein Ari01nite_90890 [Actinoplanes rishiriensis]
MTRRTWHADIPTAAYPNTGDPFDQSDATDPAPGPAGQPTADPGLGDPDDVPIGVFEARRRAELLTSARGQWAIFHRLRKVNINHATMAWRNRYHMPLSPHALAFLFQQADPTTGGVRITAATRTWLAGPESQHPLPLFDRFITVTRQHALVPDPADGDGAATEPNRAAEPGRARLHGARKAPPVWDLRTELADRCDPAMADDAFYAGLGYSTLDTPAGTFDQHCRAANSELDIPGGFCYLSNPSGTEDDLRVLTADRGAANGVGTIAIHTYEALATHPLDSDFPYAPTSIKVLLDQSPYRHVLPQMWHLDQALRHADDLRHQAADGPRTRRRSGPS